MYIWQVNKLVEEFKAGRVNDRQQLPYLILYVALSYIASDAYINSMLEYENLNTFDLLILPIALVILIAGTIWCYRASLKSDIENQFMARYICLGLPVIVRLTVIIFWFMLFALVINDYVITISFIDNYLNSEDSGVVDIVIVSGFELVYFVILRNAIMLSYENA